MIGEAALGTKWVSGTRSQTRSLLFSSTGVAPHAGEIAHKIFFILFHAFILLTCMVGGALAQVQAGTVSASKNILVLHAFESNVPIFELIDRGIRKTLDDGGVGIRNQFFEYLDLARNPGPDHREKMAELMRLRYGHRKIDMIITMYPEALRFLLYEGRTVFPDAPILALWMREGVDLPNTGRSITLHIPTRDMAGTLEAALNLLPDTKRVFVVAGVYETDRGMEEQARRDFKKWEGHLEFRYLSNMPLEEMLTTVSSAPLGTVILMLPFTKDITGRVFTIKEVTQQVSRVSAAPVFGLYELLLGEGIVGGSLLSYDRTGIQAAQFTLDILEDVSTAENIPQSLNVPCVPMFDWSQLRRWKLSEDRLPEGSVIVNRELTLWDFRYYIIGALVLIVFQSSLIVGLIINRRHRRSAEESLWQKTKELDQFFNVSLDLLCIANTEGYFLLLNPAWGNVLGYTLKELTSRQFLDLVHPDDLERTQKALASLVSQQEVIQFENRYRSKDGAYRWLEWTAAPAGNLIYAAARDFTDRLKAEVENQQRRDELAHVTRIAMMGELTSSLAHEINQPLAAIMTNAGAAQRFLLQVEPDIDEVRQILDDIMRDDIRASEVVSKVRALLKKEKPCQEPMDLNEVIKQVVGLIRGESLLDGLSIETDFIPALAPIYGDRTQLQQVILNLILNAAAAMGDAEPERRRIVVRTVMPDNRTVKTSVKDYGTGIDQNHMDRLFEPFYTTKPNGLGVGLSISQTIIQAHGGALEASNNPEGGATFSFTLPVRQEELH